MLQTQRTVIPVYDLNRFWRPESKQDQTSHVPSAKTLYLVWSFTTALVIINSVLITYSATGEGKMNY